MRSFLSIKSACKRLNSSDTSRSIIHRRRRRSLFLGLLSYHAFGGKEEACDRCRVLKSATHDFGGVDDSRLHQIFKLFFCRIESKRALVAPNLFQHYRTVLPSILRDPASWFIER